MVDNITKILRKMRKSDQKKINFTVEKILIHDIDDIDVKKIKGYYKLFRVRVGNYRIIYFDDGGRIVLKHIKKRNKDTYSNL